jgi:DNA-binding transcriptional LysR family regulator
LQLLVNVRKAHALGVAFVSDPTRWRCPKGVVLLAVTDLNLPLPFSLVWRKDNDSPLLAKFVSDVQQLPEVVALAKH